MENEMLKLHDKLRPLQSGNSMSGESTAGRPSKDTLSDDGETSREYQ